MNRSRVFLFFCFSFIIGIFLNSMIYISQPIMLGFLILSIFLITVSPSLNFKNKGELIVIGFCFLFLLVGIWRHQSVVFNIIYSPEKEINLIGIVVSEPEIRQNNAILIISEAKPSLIKRKILITTNKYPQFHYGDKLKINGELKIPPIFDDFDYRLYLAKDGIYSLMFYPRIEYAGKIDEGLISSIYFKILSFKNKLRNGIYNNLPPPQSSILGAMILGDKQNMSNNLKEDLNESGLRHITAISGMHITIISLILMQILLSIGFARSQSFCLSLFILFLFIIMVGFPSSAIRAGLMASAFLFAQNIGRQSSSFNLIALAAALMLAFNPLLLRADIGFQLSFLAIAGIILLSPHFDLWLKIIPEGKFLNLRSILSMTFSAQIFTLPILIFNFGKISLLAPLSNVLVLPILPFVLGSGFLLGILGILYQPLAWLFSWPVWIITTYVIKVITWLSLFPLASINF